MCVLINREALLRSTSQLYCFVFVVPLDGGGDWWLDGANAKGRSVVSQHWPPLRWTSTQNRQSASRRASPHKITCNFPRLWFLLCVQRSQVNLQTIRCHEVHKVCTKCILVTVYVLHCECFHQVTIMAILNLIVGVAMTMSIVWLIVSEQWNTCKPTKGCSVDSHHTTTSVVSTVWQVEACEHPRPKGIPFRWYPSSKCDSISPMCYQASSSRVISD